MAHFERRGRRPLEGAAVDPRSDATCLIVGVHAAYEFEEREVDVVRSEGVVEGIRAEQRLKLGGTPRRNSGPAS